MMDKIDMNIAQDIKIIENIINSKAKDGSIHELGWIMKIIIKFILRRIYELSEKKS